MVNQARMLFGTWSRKISHSAMPRNRSSRRSRPGFVTELATGVARPAPAGTACGSGAVERNPAVAAAPSVNGVCDMVPSQGTAIVGFVMEFSSVELPLHALLESALEQGLIC